MSLATWKTEFYPVDANTKMTRHKAVQHSLLKWTGLLPKNLAKHNLYSVNHSIREDWSDQFMIDAHSCALCQLSIGQHCDKCPLQKVRGGVDCDDRRKTEVIAPYLVFTTCKNPKPMIKWLRKALILTQPRKRVKS